VLAPLLFGGCWTTAPDQVVVYTALDREFSEPIFEVFTKETGIEVLPKFDWESNKTIGLTNAIIAEQKRPRCDVFWNNEILNTLRLEKRGLLEVYVSPLAEDFPVAFRSPQGTWHGLAARARVLIVNTDTLSPDQYPQSILDLVDSRWKDRCGVAKPLFGTTASHAACLFAHWGDRHAEEFFVKLRENARVESGNKQVALAVAGGQLAFGLTDTDDAIIELEGGQPVAIVYPDQGEDEMGTLFIPNALAVIKGSPHQAAARTLVDFLLSPQTETRLAKGRSAQIPLGKKVETAPRVETPRTIRAMQVNFAEAAAHWDHAAQFLKKTFLTPK